MQSFFLAATVRFAFAYDENNESKSDLDVIVTVFEVRQ